MKPNFFNRKDEIEFLSDRYKDKNFQFIVIYGRRRVGKSELITSFCRDKPHIYFLANKRGTEENADRFIEIAAKRFGDFKPIIKNFEDCFKYVLSKAGNKRFIVCIDEFSYLVEKDEGIASEFQTIADEVLKNTNIILILCGSSISMMEKGVLSSKSPLYGRRTGQWKLKPFKIKDLFRIFCPADVEEFIKIFSIFGDIPAYFLLYNNDKDLIFNIKNRILKKGEFLYKEGEILLKEEFREPDTYFDILKAISNVSKASKIANIANVNEKDLPKYTKNLESIDIIERINPITAKKGKTKTTLYFIKDAFLNFWFRFVYPNLSQLEERREEEIMEVIKNQLHELFEEFFERFCRRLIEEKIILRDFNLTKIGKQWGKIPKAKKGENAYEIDIAALNEDKKEILFCECKWQGKVNAQKIAKELIEKAKYVKWNNDIRKENYVIFAKSFKEKIKEFEDKNVYCFDLKDIASVLRNREQ